MECKRYYQEILSDQKIIFEVVSYRSNSLYVIIGTLIKSVRFALYLVFPLSNKKANLVKFGFKKVNLRC